MSRLAVQVIRASNGRHAVTRGDVMAKKPDRRLGILASVGVSTINAIDGIKCHPVCDVVQDDGGDPARSQAAVKQLGEQGHVIAFVNMDDVLPGPG
jgi:hypothetical protein